MRETKFGLFFPQVGISYGAMRERAQIADRLGYHSLWVVDHMWARGIPDMDHLESWTLMTALATATQKLRIGTLVLCNSYRNPALLAKMAATLDVISNGRLEIGIGAGWMDEEYRGYGYPFPSVRVRIEQLEEALIVMKKLFTESRATFEGKYYSLDDAANNPKPLQRPHPPFLIGGAGEKLLLRVVAEHANTWNCPNNASTELAHKLEVLKQHCDDVGRNFDDIEVSEQCVCVLGANEKEFKSKWATAKQLLGAIFDLENTAYRGTPDQVAEQLVARRAEGVTFFTILFSDFHDSETLELFAKKVVPALE